MSSVKLKTANLAKLSDNIAVPTYDRTVISPGIVHISLGAFHRAHQCVYTDELLAEQGEKAKNWALCSVGALPNDETLCRRLSGQDNLYTVVTRDEGGMSARVIGSIAKVMHAPADPGGVLTRMTDKATKIVSLTVTERGYGHDPATGKLDTERSDVAADLMMPKRPKTAIGYVVEALARRREEGLPAFTVMSCDNLQKNGELTRDLAIEFANRRDPSLGNWIAKNGAFPNSMVDRITPATGEAERARCRAEFGVEDARPVFCEDFAQWVIEDDFPLGRPPLEEAVAIFSDDLASWELMKLRILNGGHTALAYPAALLDLTHVHTAMADPRISGFLDKLTREEIIPVTPAPDGMALDAYRGRVASRFANPRIADTIARICFDGANKLPKFILPAIADRLAAGAPVEGLALVSALWRRYCAGVTESGAEIAPNDPIWRRLHAAARDPDPLAWLAMRDIYGALADAAPFREAFQRQAGRIAADGVEAALAAYARA